jgi:hypothetical protein
VIVKFESRNPVLSEGIIAVFESGLTSESLAVSCRADPLFFELLSDALKTLS